jgi:uncharacterized Zn-binding protein involved in type VI secretion
LRRYFIVLGDQTTAGGVVTQSLDSFKILGKPVAFDRASIWCPACKSEGRICAVGPRRRMTMTNGQEIAMENDLCICKCDPPPKLLASQRQGSMSFEAKELEAMGFTPFGTRLLPHDEQFTLRDSGTGKPLTGVRYRITLHSGEIMAGVTDAAGRTQRVTSKGAEGLTLEILHA